MARKTLVDFLPTPKTDQFKQSKEYLEAIADLSSHPKEFGSINFANAKKKSRQTISTMSAIAREEKRKNTIILNDTLKLLMSMPLLDSDEVKHQLIQRGIDDDSITEATAMCYTQIQRARNDTRAFETVRDTIGQKPVDRQTVITNSESGADIIRKHFGDEL